MENVGTKWIAEIAEHCQGVKIVLVALKCDLREEFEKDDDETDGVPPRQIVQYNEGLEVARRIGALRYLGTSLQNAAQLLLLTSCTRMLCDAESRC